MSPAHDVLPIVCTDYTYDSKLDIADGVPQMRLDAASRSLGGTMVTYVTWDVLDLW